MGPTPHTSQSQSSSSSSSDTASLEKNDTVAEKDTHGVAYAPAAALAATGVDDNGESSSEVFDEEQEQKPLPPLRYRLLAFSMILFFVTGSAMADGVISPLKPLLRKELNITNAQFGTVSSASSLVNSILPIIGGMGMDYWGATYAAIISSVFVLIGAVVSAVSSHTNQYGALIGGQIIIGLGSTILEGTQNKLYAHWFSGSTLAFVFGIDIAWGRVVSIITRSTAVPLANVGGEFWGWAMWVPAVVCLFNLLLCIAYWAFERSVPKEFRPVLGKDARAKEGKLKKRVKFNLLGQLPKFFWILCSTQLFQNGAVSVYSSNLSDIQVQTRGTSTLAAGYNSSLQAIVPIFLTPLAGLFFDKVGWRCIFISWTAALYIVVFATVGLTTVHPLCPILISSFALSTNAITFHASIPVLVAEQRLMGTAFGVWRSFQNSNTLILEVAAGAIQDRSNTNSYTNVIYLLIAIKCVEFCLGPIYDYLDGRWLGHSLRMPELKRLELRREALVTGRVYEGWRKSKRTTFGVLGQLTAMIATAWTLYIVYSLGT